MHTAPYTFNTCKVYALSEKKGIEDLKRNGQLFKTDDKSLRSKLENPCDHDLHLVQYKMFIGNDNQKNYTPMYFRLSQESLSLIDLRVEMDLLVIDYDFGGQGSKTCWSKDMRSKIHELNEKIKQDDILSNFCWNPTQSGMRFFTPIKKIEICNETNLSERKIKASEWESTYIQLCKCIDTSILPRGHFDIQTPSKFCAFFRLPRVVKPNGFDLRNVPIFFNNEEEFELLQFFSDEKEQIVSQRSSSSVSLNFESDDQKTNFEEKCFEILYEEPVFKKIREEKIGLSYPTWRGIGTNVAMLTDSYEKGLNVFDEISRWAENYDKPSVEREWKKIWRSKSEGYGPMTYHKLSLELTWIKDLNIDMSSSCAGQVFRMARKALGIQVSGNSFKDKKESYSNTLSNETNKNNQSTNVNTIDDVKELLRKKLVGSGDSVREEIIKDILNLEIILENDPRFANKFRKNLLGHKNMFGNAEIKDTFQMWLRTELLRSYGLQFSKQDTEDKVSELCQRYEFNPITDYLKGLPTWDQIDRIPLILEALSIYHDHKHYDLYYTYVKKFLVASVVRPIQYFQDHDDPSVNIKVDTLFVLQGEQGLKKSTFFEALVPKISLFSDSLQNIETNAKDAYIHMLNYWIIEFSEFDGLVKRSSQEFLKAFVTRKSERFRPPYARSEITSIRPSILVGTTNAKTFLNDPTGSRRFWVIKLNSDIQIDVDLIARNRDMIWSQAVSMFFSGQQWWLTTDEQVESDSVNSDFARSDIWEDQILTWLNTQPQYNNKFGFRLTRLFEDCLEIDSGRIKISDVMRVKKILEDIGLVEKRERVLIRNEQKRIKIWREAPKTI